MYADTDSHRVNLRLKKDEGRLLEKAAKQMKEKTTTFAKRAALEAAEKVVGPVTAKKPLKKSAPPVKKKATAKALKKKVVAGATA